MPVFLFTDIEGSTQLWELHGPVMAGALVQHDAILSACIEAHGGRVVKHTGDGIFAVFMEGEPLRCALQIQENVAAADWGPIGAIQIRVALHMGEAEERNQDFFGSAVNRTARLLNAAWGGQILLSDRIASDYPAPGDAQLQDYGVHMLKDLGYPQRIYGLVPLNRPAPHFPPLRSLSTRSHNLPAQPTPFVGRKRELAEIIERLNQPACRLLTITGSGGMGKTRMSLQVAAEVIDSFSHGVFQVPLASLSSTDSILTAVASAVRYPLSGSGHASQQLFNYLREKEILLILDNFEHLTAGANLVSQLLHNTPRLKIIVTSRERLKLLEEWTYDLRGLPYPHEPRRRGLEQFSAVQLFLQTARRVYPAFAVDDEQKEHLVRIVQLVEGIPLGIELAAAWVRVLSCSEIAREIESSHDFLVSSAPNVPKRHQSLRAVFENSWRLLTPDDRRALARLSVFRGGFTREAAQDIAAADLQHLSSLIDKSLLRRTADGRYQMLETLRQFAEAKLEHQENASRPVAGRHARYYLGMLHDRAEDLQAATQKEALASLEPESENIREAWLWACSNRKLQLASKAVEGLFFYYELRAWFEDGAELFSQAVDAVEQSHNPPDAAPYLPRFLSRRGWFDYKLGRHGVARAALLRSLQVARLQEQPAEIAFALYNLGVINYQLGNYSQGISDLQDSLNIWRAAGDSRGIARALSTLGIVARERGDNQVAEEYLAESLELHRATGDRRGITRCLNLLGLIKRDNQQTGAAIELLQESLAICREIDDRRDAAFAGNILGALLYEQGEYEGARQYCQESLEIREQIGEQRGMAFALHDLGNIARALEQFDHAQAYLRRALILALEIQAVPLAHYVITGIAELQASRGNVKGALELLFYVVQQQSGFEMGTNRAATLIAALRDQVDPAELKDIQLLAKNTRFDQLVENLLESHL